MITTASEKAWRFNSEVANFLFASVKSAVGIRGFELVPGGLRLLLLSGRHGLFPRLLRLEVLEHRAEIAQLEISNFGTVALKGTSEESNSAAVVDIRVDIS